MGMEGEGDVVGEERDCRLRHRGDQRLRKP